MLCILCSIFYLMGYLGTQSVFIYSLWDKALGKWMTHTHTYVSGRGHTRLHPVGRHYRCRDFRPTTPPTGVEASESWVRSKHTTGEWIVVWGHRSRFLSPCLTWPEHRCSWDRTCWGELWRRLCPDASCQTPERAGRCWLPWTFYQHTPTRWETHRPDWKDEWGGKIQVKKQQHPNWLHIQHIVIVHQKQQQTALLVLYLQKRFIKSTAETSAMSE